MYADESRSLLLACEQDANSIVQERNQMQVQQGEDLLPSRGRERVRSKSFSPRSESIGISRFLGADRLHAAEINRAFAKKAGAAFDMMSQDHMTIAEWAQ